MARLTGKTALVTGATGFLGGALVRRLSGEGVQVRALARRPDRDGYIRDVPGVEVVMGDLADADRMQELLQGCNFVFHVGAALSGSLELQRKVNVDGTRNIANAAIAAQVERIAHISTISVYGYRNRGVVTEDMPMTPSADPYSITKAEAEAVLVAECVAAGLPYTIIRPGMIYGPRSGFWTVKAFQIARRKPTIFISDGHGSAFPIFVDDVVDLIVRAAWHPSAVGEVFNCVSDPNPTWREYIGAYSALAGHQRWLSIPPELLRPFVEVFAALSPRYSQARTLPEILSLLQSKVTYSMDKARTLLDWEPQVSLADGVKRCEPYLRQMGLLS